MSYRDENYRSTWWGDEVTGSLFWEIDHYEVYVRSGRSKRALIVIFINGNTLFLLVSGFDYL